MNRATRYFAVAIWFATAVWPSAGWSGPIVEERPVEAKRLADMLGIQSFGNSVTLPEATDEVSVRLDFYKKGKLLRSGTSLSGLQLQSKHNHFNVSVIMIDSDQLQLGDMPKKHYRFDVQVEEDTGEKSFSRSVLDISKSEFGDAPGTGAGGFASHAAREYHDPINDAADGVIMEIPIVYCIKGERRISGGGMPEDVAKKNPDADVMIMYFVYRVPSAADPNRK